MNLKLIATGMIVSSVLSFTSLLIGGWAADNGEITRDQAFIAPMVFAGILLGFVIMGIRKGDDHE